MPKSTLTMARPEFSISVGGSTIIPETGINVQYIRQFSGLLRKRVDNNHQRTAIITGGGQLARVYQKGLRELGVLDSHSLDTIGIHTTHTNAKFLSYALNHMGVRAEYLASISKRPNPQYDAWLTGGTVPGQTSDAVLVDWSQNLGIETLINATNTPYIYETFPDGRLDMNRPITDITWDQYLALMGNREHQPGENVPFGITASHKASALGLSVVLLDGGNLDNLNGVFEGRTFEGTLIHPNHI